MTGRSNKSGTERTRLIDSDQNRSPGCCPGFGKRHILAGISCCGFTIVYALRVNLSVALVAMVNNTQFEKPSGLPNTSDDQCPNLLQQNSSFSWAEQGEFSWGPKLQGVILGSFFYGYILTQMIGGYLADRWGGKYLYGGGILITSALTILTPWAARTSPYLLIAIRVLEGIGEGVTFPSMISIWSKWAPRLERSFLTAVSFSGSSLGTIISFPLSGLLCEYGFDGGWPSVFYIFGSLGCLWFVAWCFLAYSSPESHPTISAEEKHYIQSSIGDALLKENLPVPWKEIAVSRPVFALNVASLCGNYSFYTILTCIPTYMKEILKLDMTENGLISALPYALCFCTSIFSGFLADYLRRKRILSTTATRKVMSAIGLLISSLTLVAITFVGCNRPAVIALLTLSVGLGAFISGGYSINQLDLAPDFTGVIMGISNTFATVPGIVGPFVAGVLTDNGQSRDEWDLVFLISAGVALVGLVVYTLFGSGEEQPWGSRNSPVSSCASDDSYTEIEDAAHHSPSYYATHNATNFDNPFEVTQEESRQPSKNININI